MNTRSNATKPESRLVIRIAATIGAAMLVTTSMTACDSHESADSAELATAIAESRSASVTASEVPARESDFATTTTMYSSPTGKTPVSETGGHTPEAEAIDARLSTDMTTLTPMEEPPATEPTAEPQEADFQSEAQPESEVACPEPVEIVPEQDDAPVYEEPRYEESPCEEPVYAEPTPAPVEGDAGMTGDALSMAHEIFDCYNDWRASQGLSRTAWDGRCCEMAMGSARGCAANRKLTHRLGIPVEMQSSHSDILQYASWRMSGAEAVTRWANSAGHNAQMRCPSAGNAACAVVEDNGIYWFAIVYTFEGCNVG